MRAFDSDFKKYLRSAKIAESLTPQEEQDFSYLMNSDEEFRRTYLTLKEKFTSEKLQVLSKYKNQDEWENIAAQFKRRPILVQMAQYKVATMIFLVVAYCFRCMALLKERKQAGSRKHSPSRGAWNCTQAGQW